MAVIKEDCLHRFLLKKVEKHPLKSSHWCHLVKIKSTKGIFQNQGSKEFKEIIPHWIDYLSKRRILKLQAGINLTVIIPLRITTTIRYTFIVTTKRLTRITKIILRSGILIMDLDLHI
jgi:hypothetical protein